MTLSLGDKPLRNSVTIVGAALVAGLQAAEGLALIPEGVASTAATAGQALGTMLFAFGVRRAIGQNGLNAPLEDGDEVEVQ